MTTPKTPRARLDADRTATPKTRLIGHGEVGHCLGPGSVQADALEDTETGERTSLAPRFVAPATQLLPVIDAFMSVMGKMARPPQAQGALTDQLKVLLPVANRLGLYDAADFLTATIAKAERT